MTPGTQRGVSAIDLLIAATIIATIVALAIPLMISTQKPLVRMNAAQEFSNFWQRARSDSKKMHAVAPAQMAQITILSDQYYFVTMDADGDGVLDPPVVINLEKRKIRMSGPFPQTYMFDWLGRAFDQNQKLLSAPAVQFSNDAGKTTVKFEGTGQPAITTSK
ncbi:MAG TPA: hypothetical protein VE961_05480 [Pyrinomonadaceae bacterium]|nr:hypothetical protein [Pyrinomonadaceae bacterium]